MLRAIHGYFVAEDPHDKARRVMADATDALNRTIYQRMVLEHEYTHANLDEQARSWCQQNLTKLRDSERMMAEQLFDLRGQHRTLALQDLFYKTLDDPGADYVDQTHAAVMQLRAVVEAERVLQIMPRNVGCARTDVASGSSDTCMEVADVASRTRSR
jgi:hypothetical protein